MKVIGHIQVNYSKPKYICEVSHGELERFLDLYYGDRKKEPLKLGEEIDLAKGHDFYRDTEAALKETQEFIAKNQKVIDAIFTGIKIMGRGENTDDNRKSRK